MTAACRATSTGCFASTWRRCAASARRRRASQRCKSLWIALPWASIHKGHNYQSINDALRTWIGEEAAKLFDGSHRLDGVAGIPFPLDVIKGGPIRYDGPMFARYDPRDETLRMRLREQIFGWRHDKLTSIARYRAEGRKTLLLLESHDIALMGAPQLVQAFEKAFPCRAQNRRQSCSG
jgi:hypothetical protein